MDFLKIQNSCTSYTVTKWKNKPETGRICKTHILVKNVYTAYIKNLYNITIKTNNPVKTWTKDLNGSFTKNYIWMADKPMKRCSVPLVSRVIQIKTTPRFLDSHQMPDYMVVFPTKYIVTFTILCSRCLIQTTQLIIITSLEMIFTISQMKNREVNKFA